MQTYMSSRGLGLTVHHVFKCKRGAVGAVPRPVADRRGRHGAIGEGVAVCPSIAETGQCQW